MRFITFLFFFVFSLLNAQTGGWKEDFNDGNISRWVSDHVRTFQLSAESGTLKITYTRTSQSDQWDNFNYTPPQTIDIGNNPIILFKIKSTVNTVLSFKPVFNNNPPLIDRNISGDNQWHTVTFRITNTAHKVFNKIYLYFDGGTTLPKSGTIWIDEVLFGDSAIGNVPVEWSALDNAIAAAEKLIANTVEGSGEGEFLPGSKSILQAAIDKAKNLKSQNIKDQKIVDGAEWDLYDACVTYETSVNAIQTNIIDPKPTKETRYLYTNLLSLAKKALIFGMHDATGYGVGWKGDDDRSDVKDVTGDYPALFSEDLNGVELDNEVDRIRYRLTSAYNQGAVITFSWHQYDYTGTHFYTANLSDPKVVAKYIPGGSYHQAYKEKLKKVARFFKSFRGLKGESIPVLFRPYHEHLGSWFWWGPPQTTTQEYNTIWQFTVEYLRDSLNVHNLIYVLSPSLNHVESADNYYKVYPGDNYVDVFGIDDYEVFFDKNRFKSALSRVANHALTKNKIAAIPEIGQEGVKQPNLFTEYFLEPIKNDETASNFVYAAVWRNESTTHHFAPYPGHSSVPDFIKFYNDPYTLFLNDLPDMYSMPVEDKSAPIFVSKHDTVQISVTERVKIEVETDERAFLRYSYVDEPYKSMALQFETGEGSYKHSVTLRGRQGEVNTIYVQASDVWGNETDKALRISFTVDTLQAPVAWFDFRYPLVEWNSGKAKIGTDASATTKTNPVRTIYFRKNFNLTQIPSGLALIVQSQGGAVAYVNGKEIGRFNIPEGITVDFDTEPTIAGPFTKQFLLNAEALAGLKIGENSVAIEIHAAPQNAVASFDAQMLDINYQYVFKYGSEWLFFDKGYKPKDVKLGDIVSVALGETLPDQFKLYPNYPNPFNPSTKIRYELSKEVLVSLEVYDILGRKVATLVNKNQMPGLYELNFNAGNLASGVYIVLLKAGDFLKIQKMLLLR